MVLDKLEDHDDSTSASKPVGKKSWRGHYCCVPGCHNSGAHNKGRIKLGLAKISFHAFPDVGSAKGKQWIKLIRRDPGRQFVVNNSTKVCSAHFKLDDFVSGAKKRCLKQHAVPSIFPWNQKQKRTSLTSKKVLQPITCDSCDNQDSLLHCDADLNVSSVELQCIYEDMDDSSCTRDLHMGDVELKRKLTDLECILSDTKKKLAETESKLEDAESKLAGAECRLANSETKLADTESKLADMECKLAGTESKLSEAEKALADSEIKLKKSLFRLENIKCDDNLIKLYTGFNDHETFVAFYEEILQSDAKMMRQWSGRRSGCNYDDVKVGPTCKLPLEEQFFMTLVRLRLGLLEHDIAYRFNISQASVSRITSTWINLMFHSFKSIETFPSWHVVKKYMPEVFKQDYPNTRIIIDATEFPIERPSSLLSQACTFSAYKNRNTVKILIGVTPSGAISFVSDAYEGSISDRKLVEVCGLLEKLEPGDEVMADKGFKIQDMLVPYGVRLNVPPFLQSNTQMAACDVFTTKKIARLRVHVERAIGRVKDYRILQGVLPASMWDSISDIIYVCCMLTNFGPPLVCQ